jgi:hypothetical protein
MSDARSVSPQQIDPLSWFTRPLVPLSFAIVVAVYGLGSITVTWDEIALPLLDLGSVLVFVIACVYVQIRTRPFLTAFGKRQSIIPVALAAVGLAMSTVANMDSTLLVQFWWAPVGVAIVIAVLAPYSSVKRIVVIGSILTVLTTAAGAIAFLAPVSVWPPLSAAIIGGSTALVALVATTLFTYTVVSRTQALLRGAGTVVETSTDMHDEAVNKVERHTIARLGARVAPFLETIAETGTVTDADRALAGQLARRLRSDLVERANRSWLDTVAENGRVFIVDPDQRADRMNQAQRSALRGLLLAALRNPATDAGSLFIELRGQPDGSTAVAMSLDMDLPEGRRAMLLAPYYLALQTTVSDMSYDPARELLRFDVRDPE